jgi:hypothetical protein
MLDSNGIGQNARATDGYRLMHGRDQARTLELPWEISGDPVWQGCTPGILDYAVCVAAPAPSSIPLSYARIHRFP